MSFIFAKRAALATTVLFSFAGQSFALDADAFSKRLTEVFAEQGGGKIEFGALNIDGNNIVATDAKLVSPDDEFNIGDITFFGVSESGTDGYNVERATISDIHADEDGVSVSVAGIEIKDMNIPASDAPEGVASMLFYKSFGTGPLTINQKGVDVFRYSGAIANLNSNETMTAMDFTASVDGMFIDVSAIDDAKAQQVISSLGYDKLTGDVKMKGDWDVSTGQMNIPEYAITLNDVGRLNIAFSFNGYTTELLKQMQEIQKEMVGKENDPRAQQMTGMAMLGLMQQLNLVSASIRFDDASLTRRVLDFVGSQQGVSGEQMAQAAKGMLPLFLGRLGMPELQQQIAAAASQYLDDPKSLEISAQPPAPVPFGQIAGAGMGDPRQIPALIGVQITANQ